MGLTALSKADLARDLRTAATRLDQLTSAETPLGRIVQHMRDAALVAAVLRAAEIFAAEEAAVKCSLLRKRK